jgi:hypothetical protein
MKPEVFVLRWFVGKQPSDYRRPVPKGDPFTEKQKEAARFGSADEARASVQDCVRFGYGDCDIGWKAVRLVKKS